MGYQMPIVCKEIYLPFDGAIGESITFGEYKEKYGINFEELFEITRVSELTWAYHLKDYAKLYLILSGNDDYLFYEKFACPIVHIMSTHDSFELSGHYVKLVIDMANKTITFEEA